MTLARAKRTNKLNANVLTRLFLATSSASINYCGGKVYRSTNIQACVAPSPSCLVSFHATKTETFDCNRNFILEIHLNRVALQFI